MTAALCLLTPVILAVFAMQMERFEAFSTRSSLPATNEPKKAEKYTHFPTAPMRVLDPGIEQVTLTPAK